MLDAYRPSDLSPHKYGVNPVISGLLFKFRPWYYDGKTVWWGKDYELRNQAEEAAELLKRSVDKGGISYDVGGEEQCQP